MPNLVYESFIRFILERSTYDANTEYWGQFIWIFDFVRGKVRYESEWHCVKIPENFICYLTDFKKMIMYIAFPVLLIFSIYLLNIQDLIGFSMSYLGPITPIGGLLLITSWIMLFFSIKKQD